MSFARDLDRFVKLEVITAHTENVEAVEDYAYNQVRAKSPVLSGAYRANHNRTSNSPDFSFSKTKTSSIEPAPTGGKFPVFYIANGAPYAEVIENGRGNRPPVNVYALATNSTKAKFGL